MPYKSDTKGKFFYILSEPEIDKGKLLPGPPILNSFLHQIGY